MHSFVRVTAAALLGIGLAGAASAQEWTGPRVVGSGENASVEYPAPSQNVVGGALTRTVGSGEGQDTEVVAVQHTIQGRLSRTVGSGESQQVIYLDPAPAGQLAQAPHG